MMVQNHIVGDFAQIIFSFFVILYRVKINIEPKHGAASVALMHESAAVRLSQKEM